MTACKKRARLILSDGTVFDGFSLGQDGTVIGETVFTTGVVGYQETLTSPNYYGQLVTQTFPLIGNYGVNPYDGESEKCHLSGYIVREYCEEPSNYRMTGGINDYLKEHGVVGIYGVDTRALTRKLRDGGALNAMITTEDINADEALEQIKAFKIKGAVEAVTSAKIERITSQGGEYEVALYDFGYERSLLNFLLAAGFNVTIVPATLGAKDIAALVVDGVVLSDGPGNPAENTRLIAEIKEILNSGLPVLGVGLGHQMAALASGGITAKMTHGHRGGNQPVRDNASGRIYVTSQNHGYVVESVPEQVGKIAFVNVNDGTCEGIRYTSCNCLTVQFAPSGCNIPRESNCLAEELKDMIKTRKEAK